MLARTPAGLRMIAAHQDKWLIQRADRAKPKSRQLGRQRLERAVKDTIVILKQGQTPFEFEAACRHGLRSGLCLQSWPWADADAAAAEVVRVALHRIGAVRPTWQQGQPEWTEEGFAPIERQRCVNCGNPMTPSPDHLEGIRAKKYCDKFCRDMAAGKRRWLFGFRQSRVEHLAEMAVEREKNRLERQIRCEWCHEPFTPDDRRGKGKAAPQRFCGTSCSARARGATTRRKKRSCEQCGEPFQPRSATNNFCSNKCSQAGRKKPAMRCEEV